MEIAHRTGSPYKIYPGYAISNVSVNAGDLIVVLFQTSNTNASATGSCADNASGGSNTYSVAASKTDFKYGDLTRYLNHFIFYAIAKATETLTVTVTNNGGDKGMSIHVYSGCAASPLDQANAIVTASATSEPAGTTITITQAEEVVVALFGQEEAISTNTAQNGFTKVTEEGNHHHLTVELITSATGNYTAHIHGTATRYWGVTTASFMAAATGSAVIPVFMNQYRQRRN